MEQTSREAQPLVKLLMYRSVANYVFFEFAQFIVPYLEAFSFESIASLMFEYSA